jgi:hypothetical protein
LLIDLDYDSLMIKSASQGLTTRYRLDVAHRIVAAVLGSFLFTSAVCILLAVVLTRTGLTTRGSAVHTATLLSFALWCGAVMWSFMAAGVRQIWFKLLLPAAVCGVLAWILGWGI